MPRGFLAQDAVRRLPRSTASGNTPATNTPPRTEANVKEADGMIQFATDWGSAGVRLTLRMIQRPRKPHIDVSPARGPNPEEVARWFRANGAGALNVAGNSEQKSPGIQGYTVGGRLLVIGPHAERRAGAGAYQHTRASGRPGQGIEYRDKVPSRLPSRLFQG